jgi:hypothetical protein
MIVGSSNDTGRAPSKFILSRETQIIGGAHYANYGFRRFRPPTTPVRARLLRVETMPLSIRCLCYKAHQAFFGPCFFAIIWSFQHHLLIQAMAMAF